jgi:hypothetical protein
MTNVQYVLKNTVTNHKFHTQVLKNENRYYITLFLNASFALLTSYILYMVINLHLEGQHEYLHVLLMVVIFLAILTEIFNIINSNKVTNIYSQSALLIFPVSQSGIYFYLFFNNLIAFRIAFYVFPMLVILYYVYLFNLTMLPAIAVISISGYILTTAGFAAIDYLYGKAKLYYDEVADKTVLLIIISVAILVSLRLDAIGITGSSNDYIYRLLQFILPVNE